MALITLTTDFGIGSSYVAEVKGEILSIAPQVTIVDITHAVAPQSVMQGAIVLKQTTSVFPDGTIHVAVVDPGVGTKRSILLVYVNGQYFVGPDNGLLSLVVGAAAKIREVDRPEFWRPNISPTFHGRDIMGPVAAHLANGVSPSRLSSAFTKQPVALTLPQPTVENNAIDGEVVYIDSFGNLITNISTASVRQVTGPIRIEFKGRSVDFVSTYAEATRGATIALIGSSGWLEIAISSGNARETLKAETADPVRVVGG